MQPICDCWPARYHKGPERPEGPKRVPFGVLGSLGDFVISRDGGFDYFEAVAVAGVTPICAAVNAHRSATSSIRLLVGR